MEYSIYCSTELLNNAIRSVLILFTLYRRRNGGTEWLSNLLEATQLASIEIQLGLTPNIFKKSHPSVQPRAEIVFENPNYLKVL